MIKRIFILLVCISLLVCLFFFGKVILTDKYDKVAEDNYVSVLVNDENKVVVSFLYKAVFPDEAQYIFYTSNDDSLIREYVDDSLYSYIKKIDNNWYFVQLN